MPTTTSRGKKAARKRAGPKTKASKTLAKSPRARKKVKKVMHEFKEGDLRSGSKKGPIVKSRKQAIAIALSEAGASNRKPTKKGSSKKR
jgi:hypothetical protein